MTNENKNINELVAADDDDPTAELETLGESGMSATEADAHTFDFEDEEPDADVGGAGDDILTLKADLKARAESISKLQFDIEHLRAKWTGLEKEIKVREDVTRKLTEDLKSARKKQSKTQRLLKKRENELESLRSELARKDEMLADSTRQIEETRRKEQQVILRLSEVQAQSQKLAAQLDDHAKELEDRRREARIERERAQSLSVEIDQLKKELAASREGASDLQQYIDRRKVDWQDQETRLLDNSRTIEELSKQLDAAGAVMNERDELLAEIAELRKTARDGRAVELEADNKLLAEQSGRMASQDFEINALKSQIARTETYADELRRQLQDQLGLTDKLQSRLKHLDISLAAENLQAQELVKSVQELRAANSELAAENAQLKETFENEMRQVRFELTSAQETIADRESLNEQLTSDLITSRGLSVELETRLDSTEQENKATISELGSKLKKSEALNEELSYKLSEKDNAISALLNEFAKRNAAIESIGEIENVIHELDDRMSERIDDRSRTERERITRLLIGEIEGQELRFPLFKDRLTIGRTVHNDIQLRAPTISRRHAVVVTDEEGTRIVDWGSKNGVFVNSMKVKEQTLRSGDIVSIGTADFRFEERPKR